MDDLMFRQLKQQLIKHEGYAKFPYIDTVGKITIGIGRNLSDIGITDATINQWFTDDVNFFYNQLYKFPFFAKLNQVRQMALVNMAFMGWQRFLGFKKMLVALEQYDYATAAKEMLDSKWAHQVGQRAIDLSNMILKGE